MSDSSRGSAVDRDDLVPECFGSLNRFLEFSVWSPVFTKESLPKASKHFNSLLRAIFHVLLVLNYKVY